MFVRQKISLDEFFKQFFRLRDSNLKASKIWEENLESEACGILTQSNEIDFQFNPESRGFTKIVSDLYSWTDLYDPDRILEMDLKNPDLFGYRINEEFLRRLIKEDFLPRIGKCCEES